MPDEVLEADDEMQNDGDAAAAVFGPKKKLKIQKGGTVEGGKRTLFDAAGAALEGQLTGSSFASIVEEKKGGAAASNAVSNPEDRVNAVRARLKAAAAADKERERERVRDKHKEQKRKRKEAESDDRAEREERVAVLGVGANEAEGDEDDVEDRSGSEARGGTAKNGKRARREARESRAPAATHEEPNGWAGQEAMRRDERAAERKLAMLLGGK